MEGWEVSTDMLETYKKMVFRDDIGDPILLQNVNLM